MHHGVRPAALGSPSGTSPFPAAPVLAPPATRAAYARRRKPLRINSMELTGPARPWNRALGPSSPSCCRRWTSMPRCLPSDVTYNAIYRHKQLVAGGNPIERALLATGILPHTAELMHRAHRSIFGSPAAAEHAGRNYRRNAYSSPIWHLAVVSFQLVGQLGPRQKPRPTALAGPMTLP